MTHGLTETPGLKTRPRQAGPSTAGVLPAALAAVCLAGAIVLHANQDRWSPPPAVDAPTLLYVRAPAVARRAALGYKGFAADVYWIRALQHFGEEHLAPPSHVRTYALLYPLLDLTTTLDPYFSIAYRFGAIYLGEPYPGGPGRPDLAIALLNKGLASQPDKWQYMQDLGFVYYWHLHDYRAAADAFQRASAMPGAPNWMRPLAAVTLAEGGNRNASRALWTQLAQADETVAARRGAPAPRAARRDGHDRRAAPARAPRTRRQHPVEPVTWQRLVAAALASSPASRSTRPAHAVRPRSRDRRHHRRA